MYNPQNFIFVKSTPLHVAITRPCVGFLYKQLCHTNLLYLGFHPLGPLGWVGHRVAMSVYICVSFIKVVIVDNGQSIKFFVFLYKIEWIGMVLRI